ncbi:hypothetical protein ABZ078_07995 [Streptomyces sp. NPDC006385]|uniref:hypothetical protein n=1 Tax=Streptomyces sp. NPDC006385 TaxID=3156761 RepID=UPI0033B192CB
MKDSCGLGGRTALPCGAMTALDLMERAGDRAAARPAWTRALELAEGRPEVHPLPEIRQRPADADERHGA